MSSRILSADGKFEWTGEEWVPVPRFVVRKKMLRAGILSLIVGIITTPLIIGFCIAPMGLLLIFFSILQLGPGEPELTTFEHIAEAKGYVKWGLNEFGQQLYGPPDQRLYRHTVELKERQKRE